MKNNLWQAGMSLPEILIGGALMAGLGLVGAEMFKQQNNAAKYAQVRVEIDALHNNTAKILSDYRHCNANLFGAFGQNSIASSDFAPAGPRMTIKQCCPGLTATCAMTGAECTSGYTFSGNVKELFDRDTMKNRSEGAKGFYLSNKELYDASGALGVTSAGVNIVKKAELRLTYTIKANLAGVDTVTKKIPLQLKFTDTGGFVTCVDSELNTKNTLQQELCKGLDQNVVRYDEPTDKCVRKNTTPTHTCPAGQVLVGLNSIGNSICEAANTAFDESQAINQTDATTCGGNPNVKFTWDSATNTIKVECP